MAYSTIAVTSVADMFTAIATFAGANGWTVDKQSATVLFLHNGNCKVVMDTATGNVTDYISGSPVVKADPVIRGSLCSTINTALNTFNGHVGGTQTTGSGRYTVCNQMSSPTKLWMFSNAANTYIHVVIKLTADEYGHISFGFLDAKGLSLQPPMYLQMSTWQWWKFSTGTSGYQASLWAGSSSGSTGFVVPHAIPFADTLAGVAWNSSWISRSPCQHMAVQEAPMGASVGPQPGFIYPSDLLNTVATFDTYSRSGCSIITAAFSNPNEMEQYGFSGGVSNETLTLAGRAVLRSIPKYMRAVDSSGYSPDVVYVGEYPDVRFVNLKGILPEAELLFGGDTFVCFPVHRKGPEADYNNPNARASSTNIGIAYKKVS